MNNSPSSALGLGSVHVPYMITSSAKETVKTIDAVTHWFARVKSIVPVGRVRNESLKTKSATWVFPWGRRKPPREREREREGPEAGDSHIIADLAFEARRSPAIGENGFDKGEQLTAIAAKKWP